MPLGKLNKIILFSSRFYVRILWQLLHVVAVASLDITQVLEWWRQQLGGEIFHGIVPQNEKKPFVITHPRHYNYLIRNIPH